jgi:hypothetical protein
MLDHNEQDHDGGEPRREREMRRSEIKHEAMPGYQNEREHPHHQYAPPQERVPFYLTGPADVAHAQHGSVAKTNSSSRIPTAPLSRTFKARVLEQSYNLVEFNVTVASVEMIEKAFPLPLGPSKVDSQYPATWL